jgi:hypothetical protein
MKKKTLYTIAAIATIFSLNVQWLGLIQDGYLFSEANAMRQYKNVDLDGGGGGNFIDDYEIPPSDVIVSTPTVPNPPNGNDLHCPWECGESYWYPQGFTAIPQMCTEGNEMVDDIRADIQSGNTGDWDGNNLWGDDSVYQAGEKVAWDGLWVWPKYNVTTGIGWTAWWVALANYCEGNGYWSDSNKEDIQYGETTTLTFTIAAQPSGAGTYSAEIIAKTAEVVRIKGNHSSGPATPPQTVTTPNFNSPFVYLTVPDGMYSIELDSEWDKYQSITPAFTRAAAWDVLVQNGEMSVEGIKQNHLFYELAMHRIDLTRNGINFESKDALVQYLQESDFFSKLAMSETEKDNSLGYLIPNLPDSENYYLTVLTDESVNNLSSISVTPAPEKLVRTYYAVYPTTVPVQANGDLSFEAKDVSGDSIVKEYGEIIIKPEMYVFWK